MTHKKIAVIGAGLAGLTAAHRLTQSGLYVDVFEAKNRVGGRIFTVLMKNYLGHMTEVELGGQNITDGGESVHVQKLIQELALETQEKIISINLSVYEKGRYSNFDDLLKSHCKTLQDLHEYAQNSKNIGDLIDTFCGENALLGQALHTRMNAYEGVNTYAQSIYHNIETLECSLKGGVAKAHEAYENLENQVMTRMIRGGNAKLPLALSKTLKRPIHFNKMLGKVMMHEDSVHIEFKDGSAFEYEYVIIAVPSAVFEDIDFTLSCIAPERLARMRSLSYGENYKIALSLSMEGRNNVSSVIMEECMSFSNHDDTIHLLYANKPLLDIKTPTEISAKGISVGSEISWSAPVAAQDQHYASYTDAVYHDWKHDACAKGSYCGYSTALSKELDAFSWHENICYKNLFTPVKNKLFFAGEHTTILDCIGTMEAAVESGERVAKAILHV